MTTNRLEGDELYKVEHDGDVNPAHVRDVQLIFTELAKAADAADLCDQFDEVLRELRGRLTVKPVPPAKKVVFRLEAVDSYGYRLFGVEADDEGEGFEKLTAILLAAEGVTLND